jgi:hypothetical protein
VCSEGEKKQNDGRYSYKALREKIARGVQQTAEGKAARAGGDVGRVAGQVTMMLDELLSDLKKTLAYFIEQGDARNFTISVRDGQITSWGSSLADVQTKEN